MKRRKPSFTPKEAAVLQYAVVHQEDFWKPDSVFKTAFIPKNKTIERIMYKLWKLQEVKAE